MAALNTELDNLPKNASQEILGAIDEAIRNSEIIRQLLSNGLEGEGGFSLDQTSFTFDFASDSVKKIQKV
jgi:hypothetical protein